MILTDLSITDKKSWKHWTPDAINCYNRHCLCTGCPIDKIIGKDKCRMKEVVLHLVRFLGAPPKDDFVEIIPGTTVRENKIIQAILNGAKTYEEIAQRTELTENVVKFTMFTINKLIEEQGYSFKGKRNKFAETIAYLMALKPKNEEENINMVKGENQIMFDEDLKLKYPNSIAPIVEAVKKGYFMPAEIEKVTCIRQQSINAAFCNYANFLAKHKLINPNNGKTKRQSVIDFIQSRLLDNDYVEPVEPVNKPTKEIENVNPFADLPTEYIGEYKGSEPKQDLTLSEVKMKIEAKIKDLEEKRRLLEELIEDLNLC